MQLDTESFLVFVLLHEAGHVSKATEGAAFQDGRMSQLNTEPSKAKAAEKEADDYVAEILRRNAKQPIANSVSLYANAVVNELFKLSWNMQAYISFDEFGATAIGKPAVFFDDGYTHPNLAWRILRVNHLIQNTAETLDLLQSFLAARQRGINPKAP